MANSGSGRALKIVRVHPEILDNLVSHHKKKAPGQTHGVIAPGFTPAKRLDMKFDGGKTLQHLQFKSFYLGGAAFPAADKPLIDAALSGAMSDPPLNNVIQQYFPQGPISTTFLGSTTWPAAPPATFTRDSIDTLLGELVAGHALTGVDFNTTVICFFLPPGIILTDDRAAASGGAEAGERRRHSHLIGDADDEVSSLQGLGGYHGSAHIGGQKIYFAVAVYSQMINGKPNGIPFWPDSWKNIVATFYHELNEARTDPDVEEYNLAPGPNIIGWYANVQGGGEIGDIPINEAGNKLALVMTEVRLANGATAPIQLMWSNAVHGPEGPFV